MIDVEHLLAFTSEGRGGNPAGVAIVDHLPSADGMQRIAAAVGYSETVFAAPRHDDWKVRYFAPAGEVSFCGHATIALGVALADKYGPATFRLRIANGTVDVTASGDGTASFVSPPPASAALDVRVRTEIMAAFALRDGDMVTKTPPRLVSAGARHAFFMLNDRARLRAMAYDFGAMRTLMRRENIATIALATRRNDSVVDIRNAFAFGDVVEDPATGAAAAAVTGYLRELGQLSYAGGAARLIFVQGEDMGRICRIEAIARNIAGEGIRVAGAVARRGAA